ncbi:MAG: hypothetical protein M0D55_11085 [Elusimicrobiota bacterium]|nr:MAG: hypothetical protein M0D55_11085 [Elusimicrobiota bacterium]
MDPLHAWKDDFGREVEEVLASRARAAERGDAPPDAGFGGRLADLVIPPPGPTPSCATRAPSSRSCARRPPSCASASTPRTRNSRASARSGSA